ncbi:MAG: ribonuclease HII [Lentihominibacter sp.]|jgi:ribonuclease HII
MTKEERLRKQRERLAEMKIPEAELHKAGYRYIAGVDEAGRGPLAGPVVAAAVVLPENFDVPGVDDSKKLPEKRREKLYDIILENVVAYGIGMADHETIDEINILKATKLAMKRAVEACEEMLGERAKLDLVLLDAVTIEEMHIPQKAVVKGDSKVLSIAAASIVAKVTRDRMMAEYAKEYPRYAFESNKGYGTAAHYAGIREHGMCPIHRRTFLKEIH